jgi:hypothetical protein
MLNKAWEYLDTYEDYGDVVPHVEGIADVCKVSMSTVYLWAKEHEAFSDTLEACKTIQARVLKNKGLDGNFQPTIAKLMLANHGYSDKQQVEHSGNVTIGKEFDGV